MNDLLKCFKIVIFLEYVFLVFLPKKKLANFDLLISEECKDVCITSLTIVNTFSNEYLTNVILYNSKNLLSNKNLIFYTSKQLFSTPKRKKHMYLLTCTKIRSKGGGFKIDGTFLQANITCVCYDYNFFFSVINRNFLTRFLCL